MEALRQDDPRHFGPYTVLARFRETASAVHYLAGGADADDIAVVAAARPSLAAVPAFSRRFQSEARTAERLAGGWVQPPLAAPADALWTAAAYVPALTLAEAIDLAGPLPERAVRILGAGLAETLSRVHATGAVLQGLAPGTVLLAEDGPRLTAFGPLGAAAAAEANASGQLSVRLGYLTPEQVDGKDVGPASDLFVLGLLLAYAATGTTPLADGPAAEAAERIAHASAELDSVPDELRDLIAGCLAKDPADRPSAGSVAAELALEGAAGLAKGGWLPERLAASVADQAARVRALRVPQKGADPEAAAGQAVTEPADSAPAPASGPAAPEDVRPASERADGASAGPQDARPAEAPSGAVGESGNLAAPTGTQDVGTPDAGHREGGLPVPASADGDIGDSRTTRFLGTVSPAPRTDRATTQLAVPRELAAGPQAQPPEPVRPTTPPAAPVSAPAAQPYPYTYPAAAPQGAPAPLPLPAQAPAAPAAAAASPTSRRALLTVVAAGAAGLIVGGGAVAALGSGDDASAADDKPAPKPRRALPGQAPEPSWIYTHPAAEPAPPTSGVWGDKLLVLTGTTGATGIDLRTGRKLWERADAAGAQAVLAAGKDLCFLASPTEFLWLSPKDGQVKHRVRFVDQFTGVPNMKVAPLTGQSGSVVWFTGSHTVLVKAPTPKKGQKPGKDTQVVKAYFFAYDIVLRKELWRVAVPAGRSPGTPDYRLTAVRAADLVVRQNAATLTPADVTAGKGKAFFRCFDRKTGKLLWSRQFGALTPAGAVLGDEEGRLYGGVGDDLQAFETATAKPVWTLNGTAASVFGTPVLAGKLLHTTNRNQEVGAVDRATGKLLWRRSTEVPLGGNAPTLTLSSGAKTLLAADASQVTAFAAADGRRLWKFQDIGAQDPEGATVGAPYRVLAAGKTVVVQRGGVFYAFPVE
ncbi:PQQ-binding-like beta-propeller repeat protein [Streptomyces sp. NBC_00887]|uniref:outer membrane protein assembly factor BamB family protein n=1 Tax=Streptomyces sp. NBC_00887 TaxID=2975859 RepID=UPI0038693017|nr:PQQ-binding-like beta-propeller repeat protein [Streptomyces sp. NBC_00887]